MNAKRLYTEREVSEIYGIPRSTLRQHRHYGKGLPWVKIEGRVFYRHESINRYLNEREQNVTKAKPIGILGSTLIR